MKHNTGHYQIKQEKRFIYIYVKQSRMKQRLLKRLKAGGRQIRPQLAGHMIRGAYGESQHVAHLKEPLLPSLRETRRPDSSRAGRDEQACQHVTTKAEK